MKAKPSWWEVNKEWVFGTSGTLVAIVLLVVGCIKLGECGDRNAAAAAEKNRVAAEESFNGPCHDESTLLGTPTGSPSHHTCPNRLHRMRVQPATVAANEEIGALVFCECERGQNDAGAAHD